MSKAKRKVIKRSNRLIKWLYSYICKTADSDALSNDEKFALLEYEKKIRAATQELIDNWK